MNDFANFSKTVTEAAKTTGQPPKVSHYFWMKVADGISEVASKVSEHFLTLVLVALTIILTLVGLFTTSSSEDGKKWALDAAKLCLGAFLGLFAGSRLRKK